MQINLKLLQTNILQSKHYQAKKIMQVEKHWKW